MRVVLLSLFMLLCSLSYGQRQILTAGEFQSAISSSGIVVVEIYAGFSERANSEYLRNCQVYCLDIEEIPQIQKSANVKSLPMLLIYRNGYLMRTYKGNILLELEVPIQEVQDYINSLY